MHVKTITAEALELALVARKLKATSRWAAMSAHTHTGLCRRYQASQYRLQARSLCGPMSRGDLWRCADRVRSLGRAEVLATFGVGIRTLEADIAHPSLRA